MSRLITIMLLQILSLSLMAQEWVVPEDKRGKLSPFMFNDESRKAGEKLFAVTCMSCHGTPGKGNFAKLVPPPGDPATDKIQHNTDGEIFFKVSTGRGPMPSFKNSLQTKDIWNIISYLRSFNSKYNQKIMPVIKSSSYPGAVIGITMAFEPEKNSIMMKVLATGEKSVVPVKNAGVKLLVKRTFGYLPLDEEKTTDSEGVARFAVPASLPGDTAGNLYLSAGFVDEETYGATRKDTILKAGKITIPESLVRNRAMWNNVRKAPVWIILTYSLGVLGVWGFIFFVLLKLRDIFVIGEHLSKKPETTPAEDKQNLNE
jgi:cytochrome c553